MAALLWKDCRRILSRVGRKAIPSRVFRWPWFCFSSSCLSFGFLDALGAAAIAAAEVQGCYPASCGVCSREVCAVDAVAMAVADSAAVVLEAAVLVGVVEDLAASGVVVRVVAARAAAGNEGKRETRWFRKQA